MHVYTVHLRRHGLDPDRDFLLIREGFSWPAFVFGGLWALWHRLWWAALALLAVRGGIEFAVAGLGANLAARLAVDLAFAIGAGLIGNDLLRRRAARDGFADMGVVAADGRDAAERRFLDSRPDIASGMAA